MINKGMTNGSLSNYSPLAEGVSQGSTIGPLLCVVYVKEGSVLFNDTLNTIYLRLFNI